MGQSKSLVWQASCPIHTFYASPKLQKGEMKDIKNT